MQSALVVDEATGFMETSGGFASAFDGQRKDEFLRVFKASGLALYTTCKNLGISHHTIHHHVKNDPAFREAFEQVRRTYADDLEAKSRSIAMTRDSATLERIFHLRSLFPEKYAREQKSPDGKIEINITGNLVTSIKRDAEVLETTVVRAIESGNDISDGETTTDTLQISDSPSRP